MHEKFVICKRNRLQTYLLTNLIINLMVLVDKENVKGYVQITVKFVKEKYIITIVLKMYLINMFVI